MQSRETHTLVGMSEPAKGSSSTIPEFVILWGSSITYCWGALRTLLLLTSNPYHGGELHRRMLFVREPQKNYPHESEAGD